MIRNVIFMYSEENKPEKIEVRGSPEREVKKEDVKVRFKTPPILFDAKRPLIRDLLRE